LSPNLRPLPRGSVFLQPYISPFKESIIDDLSFSLLAQSLFFSQTAHPPPSSLSRSRIAKLVPPTQPSIIRCLSSRPSSPPYPPFGRLKDSPSYLFYSSSFSRWRTTHLFFSPYENPPSPPPPSTLFFLPPPQQPNGSRDPPSFFSPAPPSEKKPISSICHVSCGPPRSQWRRKPCRPTSSFPPWKLAILSEGICPLWSSTTFFCDFVTRSRASPSPPLSTDYVFCDRVVCFRPFRCILCSLASSCTS